MDADLQWSSLLHWRWLADVGLVATLIYQVLLLLRGSRSGAMLAAVGLLFGLHYVSREEWLDLPTVHWLLDRFLSSIVLVFVILFQEDIRRALTSMVRAPLVFSPKDPASNQTIEEVLRACTVLSQRQLGALIVLEQEASLERFIADGVRVNAEVSWQLLLAMFIPEHMNATHDGAVIIRKNRIAAAACFLPLAGGAGIPGTLGSRHRAALGLADETDAIVVVAGMDGALPSVVGGLVACPVFAVPTSIGYGAAFQGLAALMTMLNACSAGVAVVNIDGGFKGGYLAALVATRRKT